MLLFSSCSLETIILPSFRRLIKEVEYYKQEAKENQTKLQLMKAEVPPRDVHDIKKFEEVLGESYMMIPDSQGRLLKALVDLQQFLKDSQDLDVDGEWYKTAHEILDEHSSTTTTSDGSSHHKTTITTAITHHHAHVHDDDDAVVSETNVNDIPDGEHF